MRKSFLILALIPLILHSNCSIQNDKRQAVNSILGDASFIQKFGYKPDKNTDENLRIQTHLKYVENLLRTKRKTDLNPLLQQKRNLQLDLLHEYWSVGIFPRNYDYKQTRIPCFIDKDNRICAVGYLIEKSAGRQVAETINNKHKYEEILAMNDNIVDKWIENSGLTKEECAMIQPSYGGVYPTSSENYITPAYGISSSALGGINVAVNTLNLMQTFKGTNSKTIGIIGLLTGAGQTILGVSMFPKTVTDFYGNTITTNENKKNLSMANIGIGTATMFLSAWNLITNRKPKETKTTWNLNSFESQNSIGMAVTFTRKI